MDQISDDHLETIFFAALEIHEPGARASYLAETCGHDTELRQRVDQMLAIQSKVGSFMESSPLAFDGTVDLDKKILDAGLAAGLREDQAIVVGSANHSVLKSLSRTLNEMPRVVLRDPQEAGIDPIVRPRSKEVPADQSDSRYRLDGEIARGGMGAIIKGRDVDLGRDLAIKVLLDSHKDKPEVVQRFVEEAQIGGQLQHPGIVPVYELGQFGDQRPFFSMKLVKGQTLAQVLSARKHPSEDRAKYLGIFEQVCQTMAYAHSRGVIHRDLKPANIMIGAFGEVQVMDWGLAKVLSVGGIADEKRSLEKQTEVSIIRTMRSVGSDTPGTLGSQTQMGSVMGTPAFMSPEQALGEVDRLDERTDVFGLGAILCEILTGKPPYVAPSGEQVFRLASRGKLEDCYARLDDSEVDAELLQIAHDALALEPDERLRDAGELSKRVSEYLQSVDNRLRQAELERHQAVTRSEETRKRQRVVSALAASLLIGVIASTWFAFRASEQQKLAEVARLEAVNQRNQAEKSQQAEFLERQKAEAAGTSEAAQRIAAVQERDRATALNEQLQRQQEQQRRMLYISDMNLVQSAWEADNISRVLELLNAHRPQPGQVDLRGFEWHYWNRQCHSNLRTVKPKKGFAYTSAVFSPDGKRLVGTRYTSSFSVDASIVVWDTETGAELQSLESLEGQSSTATLAWHPDRQHVAITSFNLSDTIQVQMLDLASDKLLFKIVEPTGVERLQEILAGPSDLWFSSDGTRLATVVGKREGELPVNSAVVKFWDAQTGVELAAVPLPGERVSNVTISVDGERIAYASHVAATESSPSSELIIILNVETPDKAVTIPLPRPASFRFSPDGRQLLASGVANDSFSSRQEGGAGVFDTSTGHKLVSMPDSDPWFIAKFSPDGQWLAVNTFSRPCSVKLYHTTGDRASTEFQGHTTSVKALSFSPDSKSLFTASSDNVIKTWDVAAIRSEPARQASVSNPLNTFSVVSNDGRQIATAPRQLFGTSRLATDTRKRVVTVSDDAGKVLYQTPEFDGPIRWMKFSADGRRLVACSVNPNADTLSAAQICVWDAATGTERLSLRLPYEDNNSDPGAALSPDGSRLAVIVSHGPRTARTSKIKVWEIDSKREVWESDEAKQHGADLLFSPNGRLILGVPARFNTSLAVWDAEDGRLLWTDDRQFGGLGFSDDSTQILGYNHRSEKIQLWNARSGVELVSVLGPSFSQRFPDVTKLSLSSNGKHLAAMGRRPLGTRSNDAVVWDMNGPEREQLTLKGHSQIVRRVGTLAFSPDSRRIVTSAGSIASIGEIKLWDVESGQAMLTLPGAARNLRFNANGSILIGEMGFNLVSEIRVVRWDASPLSPHVEAEQMIEAFTSRGSSESLPLMSEILARIDADKALPEETRAVAVTLAKGLRREQELYEAAWQIAHLPSRPMEKYDRALRYLEEAGTTDPENRDAWSTRGLLHYRLGQPTEALAALAHNRKLHAEQNLSLPADDYVTLAMIQFQAGQHEESRSTLERVWTSVSRSDAAWMKLMDPSGGDRSQDYSTLIRKLPEWLEIVAEAETLLGVPKAADNPTRWIGKAFMPRWSNRGNSPNLPYIINRIEGDRLWFGKNSITQLEVVPLDSASQYFTRLLEFAPQNVDVHNYLGIAARATGRYDEAIEHYSAAIGLQPRQSVCHHNRGLVWHEDNRDFDKGLADYDEALSLSPSSAEFHLSRGILRLEQGHTDDALKSFDEAIHLQPDLGGAYAHRATIWSARGDKVRMQKDLDDAILYSPDDPGTLGTRAWLMATSPNAEHRNGKQAVVEATRACEQLAGVADIYRCHDILAASYAETGDFEQAVKWQEKALAIAPSAWRADFESRLKLYLESKPYRELPKTLP